MHLSIVLLAAASSVHALPKSLTARAKLPGYFLLANGTRMEEYEYRPVSAPSPRRAMSDAGLSKRQAGFTDIEVGGADVVAQDLNAAPGESPQAFAQLFDYVDSTLCSQLGCDNNDEYCVTASTGSDVCITAQGAFPRDSRPQFISSTRGSFDRAVRRQEPGQGVIETGPDFVHFQSRESTLGVGDIRVSLRNQASGGGGAGCGAVISTIAAGGALFPQVATPFGALSFFCGAADSFAGEASG